MTLQFNNILIAFLFFLTLSLKPADNPCAMWDIQASSGMNCLSVLYSTEAVTICMNTVFRPFLSV